MLPWKTCRTSKLKSLFVDLHFVSLVEDGVDAVSGGPFIACFVEEKSIKSVCYKLHLYDIISKIGNFLII